MAKRIVEIIYGKSDAEKAEKNFENTVQNKDITQENVLEVRTLDGTTLLEFLKIAVGTKYSTGDIKRTVEQGGVEVDGEKIIDLGKPIHIKPHTTIKFGKREFFRPIQ